MSASEVRRGGIVVRVLCVASIGLVGWLATAAVLSAGLDQAWPQTVAASSEYAWTRAALVDFSLQIPSVAATFSAVLGVGVSQSWSTREP